MYRMVLGKREGFILGIGEGFISEGVFFEMGTARRSLRSLRRVRVFCRFSFGGGVGFVLL